MLEDLGTNDYVVALIAVVAIIAVVIAGMGFFTGLFLVALVGLSIYFGSVREISGSSLLTMLLKTVGPTIKAMLAIWIAGPSLDTFFRLVNETGYVRLILSLFFVFYLISFGTGCIRIYSRKIEKST